MGKKELKSGIRWNAENILLILEGISKKTMDGLFFMKCVKNESCNVFNGLTSSSLVKATVRRETWKYYL